MEKKVALRLALVLMASYVAYATDPTQLQDFCVGINNPIDGVFVNGLFCKNPIQATPNDFLFKGLNILGNTNNKQGSNVTLVKRDKLTRSQHPRHIVGPHRLCSIWTHPSPHAPTRRSRSSPCWRAPFTPAVTSNLPNGKNQLFSVVLNPETSSFSLVASFIFNSTLARPQPWPLQARACQNPGVITIANAVFGSTPPISIDVLTKAFQVDKNVIQYLEAQFLSGNNY
ncbi:hypothetical protein Nepgr_022407 [Nepenthes gracilis]|uniref:Germin-like protein n=1 Tax=Nepenthes gracilis TaxID=150966 RepID=A0AAD3XYD4_NEPGR|nr:hypothetical protein Nepgr_022407 [Nepenthes gracilis]